MRASRVLRFVQGISFLLLPVSCSNGALITCGEGTVQQGSQCVASGTGGPTTPDGGASGGDGGQGLAGATPPTFAGVTSVSPAGSGALLVTWDAATDARTSADRIRYNVYVGTAAGKENFGVPVVTTAPGATSAIVVGLTADAEYFVVVRAQNEANAEDRNTVEKSGRAENDAVAPTFAGAKTATSADGSGVTLTWEPGQDDKTAGAGITYVAFASETADGFDFTAPVAVSAPGKTSVTVTGLPKPNTTYHFVVRARDAAGNLDTNEVKVSAKSGFDTTPPVFAGCASALVKDAASVSLTWPAATDDSTASALITYDVYAATAPGKQDFSTPVASFTGVTYGVVGNLAQSTTYYFVVRARDASGNQDRNRSERVATTPADPSPPTFAGLTGVANVKSTEVQLTWNAATDNQTAAVDIVYDVFQATTSGGQNFSAAPRATSAPGATSITLQGLPPGTELYFVVRARDKAGNRDSNVVEKKTFTLVSYAFNVQPIFNNHCAVEGCHVAPGAPYGLALSQGVSYGFLVNVTSGSDNTKVRVKAGEPDESILHLRILGQSGEIMPPASTQDSLSAAEKEVLKQWILQGALNN